MVYNIKLDLTFENFQTSEEYKGLVELKERFLEDIRQSETYLQFYLGFIREEKKKGIVILFSRVCKSPCLIINLFFW